MGICLFTLIFSVLYWVGVFSSEIAGYTCQTFKKYLGEENFITRKKKRQQLMGDVYSKLGIKEQKKKKGRISQIRRRMSAIGQTGKHAIGDIGKNVLAVAGVRSKKRRRRKVNRNGGEKIPVQGSASSHEGPFGNPTGSFEAVGGAPFKGKRRGKRKKKVDVLSSARRRVSRALAFGHVGGPEAPKKVRRKGGSKRKKRAGGAKGGTKRAPSIFARLRSRGGSNAAANAVPAKAVPTGVTVPEAVPEASELDVIVDAIEEEEIKP